MTDARAELRGLVESFYFDVWNRGDEEAARRILSSDLEFRGSTGPTKRGVDQFVDYVRLIRGALSGYECVIEDTVLEPPKIFAKMLFRGTHTGPFFGVSPTGKIVSWAGAALFTVAGSRIRSVWVLGDVDGLKQQLALADSVPP
jgi:predicted ester cyclase